jgi:O-antigen/teichoic acid export membrane protein
VIGLALRISTNGANAPCPAELGCIEAVEPNGTARERGWAMAQVVLSGRSLPGFLQRAATDSLVRNSLYLMASTVSTAGLGYIYWIIAAHIFAKQEVGVSSAVVSMCTTISLLTYLGPSAMLVEQLPHRERSSEWTATLYRVCTATALVTGLATAMVTPAILISHNYHAFYVGPESIVIAVLYAGTTTLLNLLGAAFIAARRAGRLLVMQTLVSLAKLLLLFPLASAGARGLVETWVISAVLGVTLGIVWLVPQMELGRQTSYRPRRSTGVARSVQPGSRQRARHRRGHGRPDRDYLRRLVGQHLTGVGGMLTPLLLPVLVVIRLGDASNADFYMTWMMGSVFFMVSPSISTMIFAEGVRADSDLRREVGKALRMSALLMVPAILIMIIGGKIILRFFGASYVSGYELLIVLAVSAIPDAVSNVAVAVWRVTRQLGYSAALNVGILMTALSGAWVLMPGMGINGVGIAWGGAQLLGAIASLPAYTHVRRRVKPIAFSQKRSVGPASTDSSLIDVSGPAPSPSTASQRSGIDALIAIASAVSTGPMPVIGSAYLKNYGAVARNGHAPRARFLHGGMSRMWRDRGDMGGNAGLSRYGASLWRGDVGGDRRRSLQSKKPSEALVQESGLRK